MMEYLKTLNHDLQGIRKLFMEGPTSINYNSTSGYSFFRDICVILYEANKVLKDSGIIQADLPNMEVIKEVRHKVKTNQGIKNRDIFNKLLKGHKSIFGDDIDNLGFYIDGETLAGSTLFPTFVFADTPLQDSRDEDTVRGFSSEVGALIQLIIDWINHPIYLESKPLKVYNAKEYSTKDIWDRIFFTEDITYNVFITRILLIQNELTTCIWMADHLDYKSSILNLDKYILLRLTSIKLFEVMRNILDVRKRLGQYWKKLNYSAIDNIIEQYTNTLQVEMKVLRNMLHYNNSGINFYDYVTQQLITNPQYVDDLLEIMFMDYIIPLRKGISGNINIKSYKSMNDFEKILRRSRTKLFNKPSR
ncbi:hypothetical protein SFC66_13160 [Terribacillus saccharophilus]|uniref:hypothetical protein n=1 Tax=Terribacillus saccharophilus TaxID=361277 RepID=UPI003982918F